MKGKATLKTVQMLKRKAQKTDVQQRESLIDYGRRLVMARKEAENLAHDMNKFVGWIQKYSERIVDNLKAGDCKSAGHTAKDIEALAYLSNCRMQLYGYRLYPLSHGALPSQGMPIYKIIEKIYRGIQSGRSEGNKRFVTSGGSWLLFKTKPVVSIGLYLILENAWKYSHPDEPIVIAFHEKDNVLEVEITNWGPEVKTHEADRLLERGYRGEEAQKIGRGNGLGLQEASDFFAECGVGFQIECSDQSETKEKNNVQYAPFKVKLTFSPMYPGYSTPN